MRDLHRTWFKKKEKKMKGKEKGKGTFWRLLTKQQKVERGWLV